MLHVYNYNARIAGSSSGVGAETARELSRHGCHVMLTGRNAQRLEQVAKECQVLGEEKQTKVIATESQIKSQDDECFRTHTVL